MKLTKLVLAGALTGTLAACGGGGSSNDITPAPAPTPAPPATTSMTVTPSLGKFSAGTQVKLKKPDGTELSSGAIAADGTATLTFTAYTGAAVIEVLGASGVTYYDEGTKTASPFIASRKLRAVMPALLTHIGVTPLTNAAAVRLDAAAGGIAGASTGQISDANAKIAAVFGVPDILLAPTAVSGTTGASLDMAKLGDKYALLLAALAKTAASGMQAADAADALALDLKDGKLDGQDGATVLTNYLPAQIADKYLLAATELADALSLAVVKANRLTVLTDVSNVVVVSNQSDVNLAKSMFTELRTTLNAFANGNQTGFLDTQVVRINADMQANVAPEIAKVATRLDALRSVVSRFEDAKAYTSGAPNGFRVGVDPSNSLLSTSGTLQAAWYGYGSFENCWTDSATPAAISKITCSYASSDSADRTNNRLKMLVYVLARDTVSNRYTYTATRYNRAVSVSGTSLTFGTTTLAAGVPAGDGTVATTYGATSTDAGMLTALTLNGTLPPSASSANGSLTTGVDTVAITAARSNLASSAQFRYALSGSVSTSNLADSSKVVTLSIDGGSHVDLVSSASGEPKILAASLSITAQTAASKFTGVMQASAFTTDKNGFNYGPTKVSFDGAISNTSSGGAGKILTGKLELSADNFNQYALDQLESASNYLHWIGTFTGTVQAPGRPLMKLVLAGARSSFTATKLTLNYSYGSNSITGTGIHDEANTANDTMTLSNQDGIQVVLSKSDGLVTKSSVKLASISNGAVNYIDGVTHSLKN